MRVTDTFDLQEFTADPAVFVERLKQTGAPEYLTIEGQDALVVQDAKTYRELLETLDRLEALEGIRRGLESMKNGEGKPAREALEAIRIKHGIPPD